MRSMLRSRVGRLRVFQFHGFRVFESSSLSNVESSGAWRSSRLWVCLCHRYRPCQHVNCRHHPLSSPRGSQPRHSPRLPVPQARKRRSADHRCHYHRHAHAIACSFIRAPSRFGQKTENGKRLVHHPRRDHQPSFHTPRKTKRSILSARCRRPKSCRHACTDVSGERSGAMTGDLDHESDSNNRTDQHESTSQK